MNIRVDMAFGKNVNKLMYLVADDSLYILLLVFLSLNYGLSSEGLWCRFLRIVVLTPTYLLAFPRLSILLSSITKAFRSIGVTILLFFYLILVYTLFGHLIFKTNDPYHFGTYGLSLWSFFHFALFDNWSEMWYINKGGCDSVPSELAMNIDNANPVENIATPYGNFKYPTCNNPVAFPIASTVIFVSFTFVCGYICVNMILAAVVIGVKNSLDEFKFLEVGGADSVLHEAEGNGESKKESSSGTDIYGRRKSVTAVVSYADNVTPEAAKWKHMLENIWAGSDLSNKSSYWDIVKDAGSWYKLSRIKLEIGHWLSSSVHGYIYVTACVCVMVLEVSQVMLYDNYCFSFTRIDCNGL